MINLDAYKHSFHRGPTHSLRKFAPDIVYWDFGLPYTWNPEEICYNCYQNLEEIIFKTMTMIPSGRQVIKCFIDSDNQSSRLIIPYSLSMKTTFLYEIIFAIFCAILYILKLIKSLIVLPIYLVYYKRFYCERYM